MSATLARKHPPKKHYTRACHRCCQLALAQQLQSATDCSVSFQKGARREERAKSWTQQAWSVQREPEKADNELL